MKIGQIQKTSLIDYPGKISMIIFTLGCNFSCPYCHNPELVDPGRFLDPIPEDEVVAFLKKRAGQIDAVVITGGEPTIQADLIKFMEKLKDMGYLIKLDTNGTNPEMLRKAIDKGIVDYIAMDIKAPLKMYDAITRTVVDTNSIKSSIQLIMDSPIQYEFRTTVSKSLLNTEDIMHIGHMIKGARTYVLQKFIPSKHVDQCFIHEISFTDDELMNIKKELDSLVLNCIIR
ncbi:MAG: anaerobic ribonucleoside-triphosphate reductase activating protein [Deltaproteobacteria bacterium]|nr:anaerobic ribonucleoside-triphosphate reductase activating protein [Deltaproteobacteria bacterium]